MKYAILLAVPLVFAVSNIPVLAAENEEKVEIKSKDGDKEFKMKVHKKGEHYMGSSGDREYILRGEAVRTVETDGEYVVYGAPSADFKYFETRRIRPLVKHEVTVEEPVEVRVEERPVIREREIQVEDDDPIIKLPGIEIND